jgi:hypothetical protein
VEMEAQVLELREAHPCRAGASSSGPSFNL